MGLKRFLFAADSHGDQADPVALNALTTFNREFKPQIRVAGGDHFDFRAWRNGAGPKELDETGGEDVEAGLRFVESYRPTHYLVGNHETRIWDARREAKDGRVRALATELISRIESRVGLNCPILPYDKRLGVLRIGHLKFLHGFGSGINSVREHARNYGSCLIGHLHAVDEASVPGLDRRTCRSVGALCRLDMPYNSRVVSSLRHSQGWAYGVIDDKTGEYSVHQAERVGDRFFVASDIRAVA